MASEETRARRRRKRANATARRAIPTGAAAARTRLCDDGRYRCRRSNKIRYHNPGAARAALVAATRAGNVDPGLVEYGCDYCGGWHLGHDDGWKSLGRLLGDGVTS